MNGTKRVVVGVVVGLLMACPKLDDGANTADAGSDAQRFCAQVAAAFCAESVRCHDTESAAVSACIRLNSYRCEVGLPWLLKSGAAAVPADAGAACADELAHSDCDALGGTFLYGCLDAPFSDLKKPPGASCVLYGECANGCDFSSGSNVCGVCASPGAPPCGAPCATGTFCNTATAHCDDARADGEQCFSNNECTSGVCRAYSRLCGRSPEGGDCGGEQDCAPTHYCSGWKPEPTTSGTCAPRAAAGSACTVQLWDSAGGCALGTWCLDGQCIAPADGTRIDGAACATEEQCAPDARCEGLEPRYRFGVCTRTAPGDACTEGWWCSSGSLCINAGDGGTCLPRSGLDAPCTVDLDGRYFDNCDEGLTCGVFDDQPARCVAIRENGQRCAAHHQCLSLNCAHGFCRPPALEGQLCGGNAACVSGLCLDFDYFTGEGTCSAQCN